MAGLQASQALAALGREQLDASLGLGARLPAFSGDGFGNGRLDCGRRHYVQHDSALGWKR
jgi:hypothetical protein